MRLASSPVLGRQKALLKVYPDGWGTPYTLQCALSTDFANKDMAQKADDPNYLAHFERDRYYGQEAREWDPDMRNGAVS